MANFAYPQLSSGALVQYPLRKRRLLQSPLNAFADGSVIASNLNANSQRVWELAYTDLSDADQSSLQSLFANCQGALSPFVFIDPTDNLLSSSIDLMTQSWDQDPLLSITKGAADPLGGMTAFTLTNNGPTDQAVSQLISAPANYQYCFSVFASAPELSSIRLGTSAVNAGSETFSVGAGWVRIESSQQLPDQQMGFTASIIVPAAQTIIVWGPQIEAQLSASRYRATAGAGGVYQNAHFVGNSITFESSASGLVSTLISIETT